MAVSVSASFSRSIAVCAPAAPFLSKALAEDATRLVASFLLRLFLDLGGIRTLLQRRRVTQRAVLNGSASVGSPGSEDYFGNCCRERGRAGSAARECASTRMGATPGQLCAATRRALCRCTTALLPSQVQTGASETQDDRLPKAEGSKAEGAEAAQVCSQPRRRTLLVVQSEATRCE